MCGFIIGFLFCGVECEAVNVRHKWCFCFICRSSSHVIHINYFNAALGYAGHSMVSTKFCQAVLLNCQKAPKSRIPSQEASKNLISTHLQTHKAHRVINHHMCPYYSHWSATHKSF